LRHLPLFQSMLVYCSCRNKSVLDRHGTAVSRIAARSRLICGSSADESSVKSYGVSTACGPAPRLNEACHLTVPLRSVYYIVQSVLPEEQRADGYLKSACGTIVVECAAWKRNVGGEDEHEKDPESRFSDNTVCCACRCVLLKK